MAPKPRVIIIEDKSEDLREVSNYLADTEFCDDILGTAGTYVDALALLEEKGSDTDVVFLDLNLPRDEQDARPEKGHGKRLLDHIHSLNQRPHIQIKVIVVSAEELIEGWDADMFKQLYQDTLVSVVRKADLAPMLKASLKWLRRDPLRDRIRRLRIDVLDQYDTVIDSESPIRERVKEARSLAIRLVRNEVDYSSGRVGASETYADDLNGLIKQLENRFAPNPKTQRRYIDASAIRTTGGWGTFLWRGTLVQHLYTLNNYRNDYEHVDAKPFHGDGRTRDEWNIPQNVLTSIERGETLGKVIELIVSELLEWYIPWHEQVYLPWGKTLDPVESKP
jgi:CheY-like chemotaxis protein